MSDYLDTLYEHMRMDDMAGGNHRFVLCPLIEDHRRYLILKVFPMSYTKRQAVIFRNLVQDDWREKRFSYAPIYNEMPRYCSMTYFLIKPGEPLFANYRVPILGHYITIIKERSDEELPNEKSEQLCWAIT